MILSLLMLLAGQSVPLLEGNPLDHAWSLINQHCADKDGGKRAAAVHVLGAIKNNSKALNLAEKALSDPSQAVRAEAATSLGLMNASRAIPKLREALKDTELKVVLAAANALYMLKDPAAYEIYYALLTGERKSSVGLVQTQLNILRNKKKMEKMAFQTGIGFVPFGGMGWEAWQTITQDDSSPVKVAAAEKIATDPDPKSEKALIAASNDDKWRVRAAAADAIGKRGDPKMLNTVSNMLLDGNETVRLQAAAAVINLSARRRISVNRSK
jgi:HEAT repeat protein